MILLIWKNRGVLVVLYFVVSALACILLLKDFIGGMAALGVGLLVTAAWTYLTKDDYYKDKDGVKQKMDTPNEFFFMSMKIWSYIFAGLSVVCFIKALIG